MILAFPTVADRKNRLDALAGLRWVAAIVVAVAHLPEISHDPALGRLGVRMLSEGIYGLTFFFILSGFVLAYGYHTRLATPSKTGLRSYYIARVARIWPLHLFTLGVAVLLPISPWPGGTGPLIANAFLLHSWVPNIEYIQSYNSVSWTLSLELFFYLVCPILLFAAGRFPHASPLRLHLVAGGVWLVTIAVVLSFASKTGLWPLYICNVCPPVRCGEFAVGVLLGLAYVRGGVTPGMAPPQSRRLWTRIELATIAAIVLLIAYSQHLPLLFRMNGYYIPAVAVMVAVFARENGSISRLMARPASVYLSDISFAFYLLHGIVFSALANQFPSAIGAWPKALVMILITGVAAAAVHRWVELPMRELILRWSKPRSVSTLPMPLPMPALKRAA